MTTAAATEAPRVDTEHPYVTAYTDGSSTGGWGPVGWAWAVIDGPHAGSHDSGGWGWGSNQVVEIWAAYQAMLRFPGLLLIVSDSEYVVKGLTEWQENWRRKRWHRVANASIWEPVVEHYLERAGEVRLQWVKGHAGLPGNEEADRLSREARLAVPESEWGPDDERERREYRAMMTKNGKDGRGVRNPATLPA